MSFLYWIRLPEHSDITSQGYVGITSKTVQYRFDKHRRYSNNPKTKKYTINNAFLKYADELVVETILEGSQEYCLLMEQRLRPAPNIGWNQAQGGLLTKLGTVCSDETKVKIGLANKGRTMSEENKLKMSLRNQGRKMSEFNKSQISKANKGVPKTAEHREKLSAHHKTIPPWEHGSANKQNWLSAIDVYNTHKQNPELGVRNLGRVLNMPEGQLANMLRRFRQNWIPSEDESFMKWLSEQKEQHES